MKKKNSLKNVMFYTKLPYSLQLENEAADDIHSHSSIFLPAEENPAHTPICGFIIPKAVCHFNMAFLPRLSTFDENK